MFGSHHSALKCIHNLERYFGLGCRKNILSAPFLFFDDLQNEVSHDRGEFKVVDLPPSIPIWWLGGEIPSYVKSTLDYPYYMHRIAFGKLWVVENLMWREEASYGTPYVQYWEVKAFIAVVITSSCDSTGVSLCTRVFYF